MEDDGHVRNQEQRELTWNSDKVTRREGRLAMVT